MAAKIGIGIQSFEKIRENGYFYVDKTDFIREWWESGDDATLITRPRRFGKTLAMSMVEAFFSVRYAGRGDLFEELAVWKEEKYRRLQGTYPVISLSFANIKDRDFATARRKICQLLTDLYVQNSFLLEGDFLEERERQYFNTVSIDMDDAVATLALYQLSGFLARYYGKKVIILLDEYDTPLLEAYIDGFWEELVGFTRSLLNAAFKTNPSLERGLLTGITRVSRESIFSDLNNLKVVSWKEQGSEAGFDQPEYELALTNHEVRLMFGKLVKGWFQPSFSDYNDFIQALLAGDCRAMNVYMNRVALSSFSYFDTGRGASGAEPERFYHGFVLGLIVELAGRYEITSNRESGFGRYDVMLAPLRETDDAIIMEFKVHDPALEESLEAAVQAALRQIENKKYEEKLMAKGISPERIRCYGFAFEGKSVLIGTKERSTQP